jgi:large subunit ribosomal protein L4
MKVDVLNMDGQKVKTVELPARIFEAPVNPNLMYQAYIRQMANARQGTHSTKTRGEVSGGGRKPWRQKGTGRARHGSIRSPIWVGGGRVHAPKPRDYTQKMPKKMRRAALRSALSVKAKDQAILVLEDLSISEPKTREMAQAMNDLVGELSVLILLPEKNDTYDQITRATNNLPDVKLLNANYLNIRDLFSYDRVIIPVAALDIIESYLG